MSQLSRLLAAPYESMAATIPATGWIAQSPKIATLNTDRIIRILN